MLTANYRFLARCRYVTGRVAVHRDQSEFQQRAVSDNRRSVRLRDKEFRVSPIAIIELDRYLNSSKLSDLRPVVGH